jgi:hypothetical protein
VKKSWPKTFANRPWLLCMCRVKYFAPGFEADTLLIAQVSTSLFHLGLGGFKSRYKTRVLGYVGEKLISGPGTKIVSSEQVKTKSLTKIALTLVTVAGPLPKWQGRSLAVECYIPISLFAQIVLGTNFSF